MMNRPMFLMGSKDYEVADDDQVSTGDEVNTITQAAAALAPGLLLPFCKVLSEELATAGAATMVEKWLAAGFVGVGELTVHGHFENLEGDDAGYDQFLDIFRVAADMGVPVSVHWDLGSTDGGGGDDAAANAEQFLSLLKLLDDEGNAPKIILCHCGVGPSVPDGSDLLDAYKANFEAILAYTNVYFDLAGMQLGVSPARSGYKAPVEQLIHGDGYVTDVGQYLLDKINEAPHRFLLGTDVDDGYLTDFTAGSDGYVEGDNERFGVATYIVSWDNYEEFLDQPTSTGETLDEGAKNMVRGQNALGVLYA